MATNRDKLSNIIGAPFTDYVLRQLANRAYRSSNRGPDGALKSKSDEEVLYLANKTAWVRLASSVDLFLPPDSPELNNFISRLGILDEQTSNSALGTVGGGIYTSGNSLAKNWILQAGTSVQKGNGINLRQGIGFNGAYGLGGTEELGYRPMPGLSSVRIETMGRLGSLRQATINFKVWNMNQLNTIEALYFRLGYSMLLEWGHTQYFKNQDGAYLIPGGTFVREGIFGIEDPFQPSLRKEDLQRRIAIKREQTSGNYDGMLGIVTNFNWAYNQEGGYDCTLRLVGLGAVMDSMRVNQSYKLPDGTIKLYKGASSALKSYVERQVALKQAELARQIQAANIIQDDGLGGVPTSYAELRQKLVDYDGFTGTSATDFQAFYDNYGTRTITTTIGPQPNVVAIFATFDKGGSYNSLRARAKFKGLYLRANPTDTNLTYIPDPFATGQRLEVSLNETLLAEFASASTVKDFTKNNGERKGRTEPVDGSSTIPFSLDFAKPAAGTSRLGAVVGYEVGIRTENNNPVPGFISKSKNKIDFFGTVLGIFTGTGPGSGLVGLNLTAAEVVASQVGNTYYYVQPNEKLSTKALNSSIVLAETVTYTTGGSFAPYFILGWKVATPNIVDFEPSPAELVTAISTWSRNPKMTIKSFDYTPRSTSILGSITIKGETTISFYSSYKGTQALTARGPEVVDINGVPSILVTLLLNIETNNPGFIDGLAAPAPTPASQTATGTGNSGTDGGTVQKTTSDQEDESIGFSSALHAMLTVVQSTSQETALNKGKKDPNEGRIVPVPLQEVTALFYRDGIFKDVLGAAKAIPLDAAGTPTFDLTAFAQKGFASELMLDYTKFDRIPYLGGTLSAPNSYVPAKFNKAIVVKYKQNNLDGYIQPGEWPVYISLGYLLAFINNMCLFYDSKTPQSPNGQTGGNDNRPYVYIDFNPETNFCLTAPQQFSVDPLVCLIPANSTNEEYLKIFPASISGSISEPFQPDGKNPLTKVLDEEGFQFKADSPYRGKIMNIMLTTQYLLNTLRDFTTADPEHAVNLHPFLERVMTDVNKALGGMNLFRIAYRDDTNTIQIRDDQYVPPLTGEPTMIQRDDFIKNLKTNTVDSGELPIFGTVVAGPAGTEVKIPTLGIAREMQFKTVMSTKMASMLAISAQATTESVNAKDHSELSYLNQTYQDRYKPYIKDQTQGQTGTNVNAIATTGQGTNKKNTEPPKSNDEKSAQRFNEHVTSIYSSLAFVVEKVDSSKNYYIERISKIKSIDDITTAAPFIPAELEIAIDGIGGIIMGNAFTIPKERLPLSLRDSDGFPRVGFIVNGLTHTIENNEWITRIKGQMIKLRTQTVLGRTVPVLTATQTGILADASSAIAGGSTVINRSDPNNPCYVPPFQLRAGTVVKLPATGKRKEGIETWRKAYPGSTAKGLKALLEAQTFKEGFFPAAAGKPESKSWRTNNPGNIGTETQGRTTGEFNTLTEGIQGQINLINKIISGLERNYPKDPTLYEYLARYAPPCYRDPDTNLYFPSAYNNPIDYTNAVIGYVRGEYGIEISADMRLSQIVGLN